VHHATHFNKITETVGVWEQSAKKDSKFWNYESWNKKGLETYTTGVS